MVLDFEVILRLFLVCLVPVAVSVIVYLLQTFTKFGKMKYIYSQIIIGVIFGGIAIFGTEVGVDVGGAQANVRDAGPLCAGLIFGAPAGIIAGVIGGVERWFAVYWGRGTYTQLACSISTIIAGFYAAGLRKFMFDNKRTSWGFGFAIGCIMEVLHLTILFLTKLADLTRTYQIIKILALAMIVATGLSVMLSLLIINLIDRKVGSEEKEKEKLLSYQIQAWMLLAVSLALIGSTTLIYFAQTNTAYNESENLMKLNIEDVVNDVSESTETELYEITTLAKENYLEDTDINLGVVAEKIGADEINVIEMVTIDGVYGPYCTKSSNEFNININMDDHDETAVFNVLLADNPNHVEWFTQPLRASMTDETELLKHAGMSLPGGKSYIQVGYKFERYAAAVQTRVTGLSDNRHVGSTGFIVVADRNQKIISAYEGEGYGLSLSDIGIDVTEKKEMKRHSAKFLLNFVDEKSAEKGVYVFTKAEGYYIVAGMPNNEVMDSRDNMLYMTVFMEILAFAVLFAMIYFLIKGMVVERFDKINNDLDKICEGNLDVVLDERTTKEFASLSDGINSTVDTLKDYIDEAASRIDKELEFAKSIQLSALPNTYPAFPNIPSIDIGARMYTAKEVGGDFYDYYLLDKNHVGFLVADVSGKGIPAAMFMMQSKATIKNYASRCISAEEVLELSNEEICKENDAGMFVTCWFGIINTETGKLRFANAGHNPPLIYHAKTQTWEYLKTKAGLVLAAMDISTYKGKTCEVMLDPGDKIFLYTDGVTEATRGDKVLYGEDRLLEYLNEHKVAPLNNTLDELKVSIDTFIDGAPQFDDITLVMLEYKGK